MKTRKQVVKLISIVLTLTMLFSMFPLSAFAEIKDLIGNGDAENNAILAQLAELAGDDSAAAYTLLENLGLLDENGELKRSYSIDLDGENMRLDEAMALLDDPDTDLSRIAYVDGVPIALGDLQTIIKIEQELERIEQLYFSDKTFTQDQLLLIDDLLDQIEAGNVALDFSGIADPMGISAASIVGSNGPAMHVAKGYTNHNTFNYSKPVDEYAIEYKLPLSAYNGAGETFRFSWKRIRGLIPDEYFKVRFVLDDGSGDPVTIPEGTPYTFTYDDMKIHPIAMWINFSGDLDALLNGFIYEGPMRGFVELTAYDGLVFIDDATGNASDIHNIPVEIVKPYAFTNQRTWTKEITIPRQDYRLDGSDQLTSPIWSLYNMANYDALNLTAEEIYRHYVENGQIQRRYQIEAEIGLVQPYEIVPGTFIETSVEARMVGAPPVGAGTGSFNVLDYKITHFSDGAGGYDWNNFSFHDYSVDFNNPTLFAGTNLLTYLNAPVGRRGYVTGEGTSGYMPYVNTVNMTLSGPYDAPYWLRTSWPGAPAPQFRYAYGPQSSNYGENGLSFALQNGAYTIVNTGKIRLPDPGTTPYIEKIEIPAGDYVSGQIVPIKITFSETVWPLWPVEMSMTINNQTYSAADLYMQPVGGVGGGSRVRVAYYKVKDVDASTILISEVKYFSNYFGTTNYSDRNYKTDEGWTFDGVNLESVLMKNAVTGMNISNAAQMGGGVPQDVTIDVSLNNDVDGQYRTKYVGYDSGVNSPFEVKITNLKNNQSATFPLDLKDSSSGVLSAACSIGSGFLTGLGFDGSDTTFKVQLYAYESDYDSSGFAQWRGTPDIVPGASGSIYIGSINLVDGLSVIYLTWPGDHDYTISHSDTFRPLLGVQFDGSPTFETGTWESSNENIATIVKDSDTNMWGISAWRVILQKEVGDVTFTFTADDGGYNDPDSSHVKQVTTVTYKVVAGDSIVLTIPDGANTLITRKGNPVDVLWGGTTQFYGGNPYQVELFEGFFTQAELSTQTPVTTFSNISSDSNSLTIPGEYLTEISLAGKPAYTVLITTPHPTVNAVLSAVSYIIVNPMPAVPHVQRPSGGLYMTDNRSAAIQWSIENYEQGFTVGELLIERVYTDAGGQDTTEVVYTLTNPAQSGSYTLNPTSVSGLKDTYMISLQVKNPTENVFSSDAFPLYVYKQGALALEVGGSKVTNLTMDNVSKVNGTLPTGTVDILAMREELGLIEYIGINYKDYSWSQLKDGIKWETSDRDQVSVNYKQGGLYEDLSRFAMETYLPETQMALSSITDGTATIKATHANTGMSASVVVNVNTLRQKFYLFQLSPAQQTSLTYTDGKGRTKTVNTNSEGVLALYEPDGINSDVQLKSGSGGDIWLGTIYQTNLVSGERDATKLQLYPLNTFTLRLMAKTEIFLKKPDGSPYTGSFNLRGGIYKNGGYCQDALLLGNVIPGGGVPLRDGKVNQNVNIGADGKLTVYMDVTQFWSKEKAESNTSAADLTTRDNIQYIFEITAIAGSYYPLLVYANGNLTVAGIMRSAENVIFLESPGAGPARPFISGLMMDYGVSGDRLVDVRHSKVDIGPNPEYKDVKLYTIGLMWGNDPSSKNFKLEAIDEFGYYPAAQESSIITYPFSSMPVVRNTLTLNAATITGSGWIPAGESVGLRTRIWQNNVLLSDTPLSPKLRDLSNAQRLEESSEVTGIFLNLSIAGSSPGNANMSTGDMVMNEALKVLGGIGSSIQSSAFRMVITPSEDTAIFNAFIWMGYNSLGMNDLDFSASGMFVDTKLAEAEFSSTPSLTDAVNMTKGKYDPKKDFKDAIGDQMNGKATKDVSVTGQLEGYFEARIQYNYKENKWEIFVLGGGFTAGLGVSVSFTVNTTVSVVPVTATFGIDLKGQLDFKTALRWSEQTGLPWASTVTSNYVNDYLTSLHVSLYISAFGGLGFDYSVVALKIGPFGGLGGDFITRFLSRTYLEDPNLRQVDGQAVRASGEVGVKFVAVFLMYSVEFVVGSAQAGYQTTFRDWTGISNYWENAGSGIVSASQQLDDGMSTLAVISSSGTLQSRDYLYEYARSWGGQSRMSPASLDLTSALDTLQTNAYPQTLPLVSSDGKLLLYAFDNDSTDVNDTRIYETNLSGVSYPIGDEIASPVGFDGFGDSGLSLAGDSDFAVAAWIRQNSILPEAGRALNETERMLLMNGAEIVASIYDGTSWTSERLTDNAIPDIGPVVAANGNKAIVAWRSVYAADSTNLLDFSQQDYILYRIYDGGAWSSEPKQLYNGTSGAVRGLSAAMLADGTAAVSYTLDTSGTGDSSYYEIGYAIVDDNGDPGYSAIITQDSWIDENPQIAAVQFNADERFVLAWHSVRENRGDIRLAAINRAGKLSNSFIDSVGQTASESDVNINGSFRLAKMSGALNDLSNLSILWAEATIDDDGKTDRGVLRAARLMRDGTDMWISAAIDVAELPANALVDHFDAYVSDASPYTVKAVIQSSLYSVVDTNNPSTYSVYYYQDLYGGTRAIYVPKEEVILYTATETYENKVKVESILADYANLQLNTLTPIQFSVVNAGMDKISSVQIQIDSGTPIEFTGLDIYPNDSRNLICWYNTGGVIKNPDYTLKADFGSGYGAFGTGQDVVNDTIYLDYPDLGISGMKTVSENLGVRKLQITLYNASAATLAGNKNRSVKLGFYDDSQLQNIQNVTSATTGVTVNADKTLTISGEDALGLIDAGAFTFEVGFNIGNYVTNAGLGEIPDVGVRLFANAWIEESYGAETAVMPEFNQNNNSASVLFDSPLSRTGRPVSITVNQGLAAGGTTANISLFNNSLQNKASGNLIVSLLDSAGNVLEKQQTYVNTANLIRLDSEETKSFDFTFSQSGSRVLAEYGDLVLASNNAGLASLSFEGLPVRLSDFIIGTGGNYAYSVPATTLGYTLVSFITGDPGATVTINGKQAAGNEKVILASGRGVITVEVTSANGLIKQRYILYVGESGSGSGTGGGSDGGGSGVGGGGGGAPATVTGGDGSVALTYSVANGIVTLPLPEKEMADVLKASKNNTAVFNVSGIPGATGVTLPTGAMATFADAGLAMQFKLPQGTVTLDVAAAKSAAAQAAAAQAAAAQAAAAQASQAAGQAGGQTGQTGQAASNTASGQSGATQDGTVTVRINPVKYETLTEAQKEAVQPDDLVFDISVFSGSTIIKDFGGGTITVTLPYDGPRPVAIWYLRADGEPERLICQYDDLSKTVTFIVNHLSLYVLGQGSGDWIKLTVGELTYGVNDSILQSDVAPVIIGDRTMVPLRFVAEALGAAVDWNGDTRTATVELGGKALAVTIGETAPGMDVPAMILSDRTMVPLRYVSEELGCDVLWDPETRTVEITK